MPLVRFQVRDEYGLGDPELYRGAAAKREDPKAILDGVAVAGLVGILRQLGDLAEFASEIFHDLHEQVTATANRGRRMMVRLHHIEEALPAVEKAVQNQKSHIHFAYIAGSDWHPHIQIEHDHLRHTDLPQFVMDSYEECHDPPRLFLLDKFDSAGPGSGACLRRYSDPMYFKRVCADLEPVKVEKVQKVRKIHKIKKKLSQLRDGDVQHVVCLPHHTSSIQGASPGIDGQSTAAEALLMSDMRIQSELESRSTSFDSRTRISLVGPALDIYSSVETENHDYSVLSASMLKDNHFDIPATSISEDGKMAAADDDDDFYSNFLEIESQLESPAAWDEKTELVRPIPNSKSLVGSIMAVNYPLASTEPEPNSSATFEESHNDAVCDEGPVKSKVDEVVDDDDDDDGSSRQDYLPEQHTPSVTWDEKVEIIGPTGRPVPDCNLQATVQDSDPHSLCMVYKQEAEGSTHGRIAKEDVACCAGSQTHFSVNNYFEEAISEAENYVDALNTLDSETETDSEFQTIKELVLLPNLSNQRAQYVASNIEEVASPSGTTNGEDSASPSFHFKKDAALQVSTSVFSKSANSVKAQDDGCTGSIDNACKTDDIKTPVTRITDEPAACNPSPDSMIPISEAILEPTIRTSDSQNLQLPEAYDGSVNFWTNGGLLGLEPSKPPDFSITSVQCENHVSNSIANDCDVTKVAYEASSTNYDTPNLSTEIRSMSGSNNFDYSTSYMHSKVIVGNAHNAVYLVEPSSSFCHSEQDDSMPTGESHEIQSTKVSANGKGHCLIKADNPRGETASASLDAEISSGQQVFSSSLSSLTRRLLTNSLQRKGTLANSDATAPPDMLSSDSLEVHNISIQSDEQSKSSGPICQEILEQNASGKTGCNSSEKICPVFESSGQSSPPLEQMKISFHPINGLEASKLSLKFPDSYHENIEKLTFPSFQLLPGSNISTHDVCSDSDDDTFSRSYPYSQDDISSPHSDINSDLWAHDEVSGDHEINYDSRRFSSSAASVSSLLEPDGRKNSVLDHISRFENLDRENGTVSFHSGPFLALPNLDSLDSPLAAQGGKHALSDKFPDGISQSPSSQPTPPPLPSLQWRTTKPDQVVDERTGNQDSRHPDQPQLKRSVALCHPEREVPTPPCIKKLSGNKGLNQALNGREPDDREDLLHQIRNKAFRLRPTVTSRPSLMPRSTTNIKVAAILEKANAIRQAFASSDEGGDDETWSDD